MEMLSCISSSIIEGTIEVSGMNEGSGLQVLFLLRSACSALIYDHECHGKWMNSVEERYCPSTPTPLSFFFPCCHACKALSQFALNGAFRHFVLIHICQTPNAAWLHTEGAICDKNPGMAYNFNKACSMMESSQVKGKPGFRDPRCECGSAQLWQGLTLAFCLMVKVRNNDVKSGTAKVKHENHVGERQANWVTKVVLAIMLWVMYRQNKRQKLYRKEHKWLKTLKCVLCADGHLLAI